MFKDYQSGIDPFVQDITSTWTRLGVLSRMPAAWWKEDDRIDRFIREKFEKHLFSEGDLNRGMTEAMQMLREDLMAIELDCFRRSRHRSPPAIFPMW